MFVGWSRPDNRKLEVVPAQEIVVVEVEDLVEENR
jgi:hypothetical protein